MPKYLIVTTFYNCCRARIISGFPKNQQHGHEWPKDTTVDDVRHELQEIKLDTPSRRMLVAVTATPRQKLAEEALAKEGFIKCNYVPVETLGWEGLNFWFFNNLNTNTKIVPKTLKSEVGGAWI